MKNSDPVACLGKCGSFGDPVWCPGCAGKVRSRMIGLPALMALRMATADGHRSGPDAERVSGSKGKPSQSPVYDQLDEMVRKLNQYRDQLIGQRGAQNDLTVDMARLTTVVNWLSIRFELAIADETVGGYLGRSVYVWHARLVAQTKTGSGTRVMPTPCPRCETRGLVYKDGDSAVKCGTAGCGHEMSEDDYLLYEQAVADWRQRAGERRQRDTTRRPRGVANRRDTG